MPASWVDMGWDGVETLTAYRHRNRNHLSAWHDADYCPGFVVDEILGLIIISQPRSDRVPPELTKKEGAANDGSSFFP